MTFLKTTASVLLLSHVTYGFVFDLSIFVDASSSFSDDAQAYLVADYTGGTTSTLTSISDYYGGSAVAGEDYFQVGDIIDRYIVMDTSAIDLNTSLGRSVNSFTTENVTYDTSVLDAYINNFISDFQNEGLVTDIEEDILTEIQGNTEHVVSGSDLGIVVVDGDDIFAFSGSDDPDTSIAGDLGWELPASEVSPLGAAWYLAEADASQNGRVDFNSAYTLIGSTIPEPTTTTLSLIGCLGLLTRRKRR